jgi:hypothetical protein
MGSCLAPTFAEYYMTKIENNVLLENNIKPSIYCRYVDDIYVVVRDENHLLQLKTRMEEESVLNFTYEMSENNSIPFLDVKVSVIGNQYQLGVYRKPTDVGKCMNPSSECPDRYKESVVRAYVHRAHKTCSSDSELRTELDRSKQILINNGFTNMEVDKIVKDSRDMRDRIADESVENVSVYYENQMNESYKIDERVIKQIIDRNVNGVDNVKLKVIIYYKNKYTKQLIIKNNPAAQLKPLQKTNVVYEISCPHEDCALLRNVNYIGMTSTTLSRRITMHLASGAPKEHFRH